MISVDARRAARNSLPLRIRAQVPDPDHETVHSLACCLARATGRNYLYPSHAYAALALASSKAPDNAGLFQRVWQTYSNHVSHHYRIRCDIERRIADCLHPLIKEHQTKNVILAEAHGVNGSSGRWLTEEQVTQAAVDTVNNSLPVVYGRRRHGYA